MQKFILKEENYTSTEKLGLLNKTLDYFRNEEEFQVNHYIETVFEQADTTQKMSSLIRSNPMRLSFLIVR